jgi:hypothetical protein
VALWTRRAVLTVFTVFVLLALLDRFGQRTSESVAVARPPRCGVNAPESAAGGLLFQSRIEVRALRDVQAPAHRARPRLDEGMQINSIEPAAMSGVQPLRPGRLSYDQLAAGDLLRIYLSFQVNPTTWAPLLRRRPRRRTTPDRARQRTLTVLP